MTIPFACPSCGAGGSVDAALVGKQVRCKQCGHRFAVPGPGETESEVYGLGETTEEKAGVTAFSPPQVSVFVSNRGEEPTTAPTPRKPKRAKAGSTARDARRREADFPWRTWLVRGGVAAALVIAGIALFAPRGVLIAGCVLMVLGSAMVLVGFGAGAYGAFCEDFLYGVLYLAIPLYTAYYLVTRWDDLWVWFACSTAGVALVLLGTEMVRWAGVGG